MTVFRLARAIIRLVMKDKAHLVAENSALSCVEWATAARRRSDGRETPRAPNAGQDLLGLATAAVDEMADRSHLRGVI